MGYFLTLYDIVTFLDTFPPLSLVEKNIYGYDYFGIVLRYLRIPIVFKNKYVCSYFVADLLKKTNVYNFDKDVCFVKPSDFDGIDNFNLIYSGKYLMYR